MKRGKDDEKMMGPMFPRLHVNDTEKGGPRAPPRNKMALYEQLSIPSQRFSHSALSASQNMASNNTPVNFVPNSVQGCGNEGGMFYSHQLPLGHQSENQCSQYSEHSTPSTQVEKRKKMDVDDFRVPIFVHSFPSQEHGRSDNIMEKEKIASSSPPYFSHSLKFQKTKESNILEQKTRREAKIRKGGNPKGFLVGHLEAMPSLPPVEKTEGLRKQTDFSSCHASEDRIFNSNGRLKIDDSVQPELYVNSQTPGKRHSTDVLREGRPSMDKRYSSASVRTLPSADQDTGHDRSTDSESCENGSCRSMQIGNLERGDSVSETSILDSIAAHDITPDDVVGIIGQKHFWKARRAIVNQQRVFAVQVFELHRLIKVQQLIAASPHLLLDDTVYLGKPVKPLPTKKISVDYAVKSIPNVTKPKGDLDKLSHKKECSAENTIPKAEPSPSSEKGPPPSSGNPVSGSSPAPSVSSDNNLKALPFNSPYGHQWLIPVMSPSEGLVYKPYPASGFMGPGCGPPGPNPVMGNFLTPAYGVPNPLPQYQVPPSFPPGGSHGYFPHPYGLPIMNTGAFSGSSVDQAPHMPGPLSAGEANYSVQYQNSFTTPNPGNEDISVRASNNVEVQASTASSRNERSEGSKAFSGANGRNVLPLFPTSPVVSAPSSSPQPPLEPGRHSQVIKVVPHNARSASESAARIFQSIQEERRQYDCL